MKLYKFGNNVADGHAGMTHLLGGKGANLAEMSKLGLPIPEGFTIPTDLCMKYLNSSQEDKTKIMDNLMDNHVIPALRDIKKEHGYLPIFSVRSGARVSMPGMMDTILNVGITPKSMNDWIDKLGGITARDNYRRLIQMFGETVCGIDPSVFKTIYDKETGELGVSVETLNRVIIRYQNEYYNHTGEQFPKLAKDQFRKAIVAVFHSWNSDRAKHYRSMYGFSDDWGTAVTIQIMVFGNANDKSCSGVLFSRNPTTGENKLTGEFLVNAQGEDVVAGTVTPEDIHEMQDWNDKIYGELVITASTMESHYRDMQDMEFTVQDSKLYILQTRSGKRSAKAAFKIAYDLFQSGLIKESEAKNRVTYQQYKALEQDVIAEGFKEEPAGIGIPAAGSIVSGVAMLSSDSAINCTEKCILVTDETTPEDIAGIQASVGILTKTGGATSHAAVVARGMDKTCVVGCTDMIKNNNISWLLNGVVISEGDLVTINGKTGEVWVGIEVPVIKEKPSEEATALLDMILDDVKSQAVIRTDWKDLDADSDSEYTYITTLNMIESDDMDALVEDLEELPADRKIIVNLDSIEGLRDSKDNELWDAFGEDNTSEVNEIMTVKIGAFINASLNASADLMERLYAHVTGEQAVSFIDHLDEGALPVLRDVVTMKDYLNSSELIVPTSEFIESLGGSAGYSKLAEAFGDKITAVPTPVSMDRLIYIALKGGK